MAQHSLVKNPKISVYKCVFLMCRVRMYGQRLHVCSRETLQRQLLLRLYVTSLSLCASTFEQLSLRQISGARNESCAKVSDLSGSHIRKIPLFPTILKYCIFLFELITKKTTSWFLFISCSVLSKDCHIFLFLTKCKENLKKHCIFKVHFKYL